MSYIKEEEIEKNNIHISKAFVDMEEYDVYYVTFKMKDGTTRRVRTFCEKNTFPEIYSKEFLQLQREYGQNVAIDFFAKRLIGPEGLMAQEGREDYIYLGGELGENGYFANRYMIKPNGKTGQDNFDDNLFKIKLQVEAQENEFQYQKQIKNGEGKTYVIADIHGMYGSYMNIMKKMTHKDRLIFLGDVIDRGAGGIQILQDIIRRKKERIFNPEITFLLGNHEMQFLGVMQIIITRNLTMEDLIAISKWKGASAQREKLSMNNDEESKKILEQCETVLNQYDEQYSKITKEKELTDYEKEAIHIWMNCNHGDKTIYDFLSGKRVKGADEQNEIYQFLLNSYVVLPQTINDKDYLFVHAVPPKELQIINQMKRKNRGYKYTDLPFGKTGFMLQERDESAYQQAKNAGFTTICGHTPSEGTIIRDEKKGYIRIDAGCGHKKGESKLALYCIEDDTVEYVDEMEAIQEEQEL